MSGTLRHMPCIEFVEQVSYYLEGTLSPEDHARLEEHLGECAKCGHYLQQLRTSRALTGRLSEDDITADMRGDLMDTFARWRDER